MRTPVLFGVLFLMSGCVAQRTYDKAVKDAADLREELGEMRKAAERELTRLRTELDQVKEQAEQRDTKLGELSTDKHNLETELEQTSGLNKELRGQIDRMVGDLERIGKERATLAKSLEDTGAKLKALKRAEELAEQRVQTLGALAKRLGHLVRINQIALRMRGGRVVLEIDGKSLFDEGRPELRAGGDAVVAEVAKALVEVTGKAPKKVSIAVANDDAERKQGFSLSSARAAQVADALVSHGVPGEHLALGDPGERVGPRRAELSILPTVEERVSQEVLPETGRE